MAAPLDRPCAEARLARQILIVALVGGTLLRILAITLGDLDPGGDGLQRLAVAARWAVNPEWQGLSGVWPPLHWYTIGSLLRVWNEPMIVARALNLLLGLASLLALRAAVRPLFGELTAALSTLILAFNWTHIWLTSSYWVEIPYLLLIFATIHQIQSTSQAGTSQAGAWRAGLWMSLAIFLRHEGIILVLLLSLWLLLEQRSLRQLIRFALLPLGAAAWHLIEPWSRGGSYFDYANTYSQMKAAENIAHAFSMTDRFRQILLMPASTPSIFVVLPGLAGLWMARRNWRRDLFLWLFVVQVAFFIFLALTTGWRPQLRYILLYFVNLFPAAALVWGIWARKWRPWPVILGLLVLTITLQAIAWQIGRNEGRPLGWLPIRIPTTSQANLDRWLGERREQLLHLSRQSRPLRTFQIVPGSLTEPWRLSHSILINRLPISGFELTEINTAYQFEFQQAQHPAAPALQPLLAADLILIDPEAPCYAALVAALTAPNGQSAAPTIRQLSPRVTIILLSPEARQALR